MTRPTDLYRAFDAEGRLLYVGVSLNLGDRMKGHRSAALWWEDVAIIAVEHCEDRAAAMTAERAAITAESPAYNQQHGSFRSPQPPAEQMPDDVLTADQAAERAGVDRRTISRWAKAERLPTALRLPGPKGARLFRPADIDAILSPTDTAGAA